MVATIIQHEAGSMNPATWEFMADQITYDVSRLGCNNLTQWRWKILSRPRPSPGVLAASGHWPRTYPRCQFVGMRGDVAVWEAAGFKPRVDYVFKHGRLTVVGVNCDNPKVLEPPEVTNPKVLAAEKREEKVP